MTTEIYIPIKDLQIGTYEQIFLVKKILGNVSSGTRIVLSDVTGDIVGVIWNNKLIEGQFYKLAIDVKPYRGELEFSGNIIEQQKNVPLNVYDYIKGESETLLVACAATIEEVVENMEDEHYRNIMSSAIHKLDLIHALKTSQYGLNGALSHKGGLLIHINTSLKIAQGIIAQSDSQLNDSLILSSCILRNIGWHTTMYETEHYLRPRDAFYIVGIKNASMRYINHLMIHVESDIGIQIPESKKQALENSCEDFSDIKTIEGRIASIIDATTDLLYIEKQTTKGNWNGEFFTGHNARST